MGFNSAFKGLTKTRLSRNAKNTVWVTTHCLSSEGTLMA